jgi:hypothetical protein
MLNAPAYADPNTAPSTDLYSSPEINGMGIPTGGINITPVVDKMNNFVSTTALPLPAAATMTNYLGCGGVGQGEYTTGLYNMPETFGKFQQDVNSLLAKQILAMNFIMPQSSALFDQLNNYGNQSYQNFQNGCNLDALKKDAKQQYLEACVSTARIADRKNKIKAALTGNLQPKEPLLTQMAYAQAWEVCTNQYVSDTSAVTDRNKAIKTFATSVRSLENVTQAIRPWLCPTTGSTYDSDDACWQTYLIPQARVCLDASLGCKAGEYTINEPVITMQRLFDLQRFLMDDTIITRHAAGFTANLEMFSDSLLKKAAGNASLSMSYAGLFRAQNGVSATKLQVGGIAGDIPDMALKDFRVNYLNCKETNPIKGLQMLKKQIDILETDTTKQPALEDFVQSDLNPIMQKMALKNADGEMKSGDKDFDVIRAMVWTSLGCTANQTIPIFDPLLVVNLNQCDPDDRGAFYAMAGYDTAFASTQSIYRYLNVRLKQVYARLMVEGAVPTSATTASAPSLTSPELNRRLATVVKEAMIPYVENQLERLEEVKKNRGEYARQAERIYANRSGCFTSPGGQ